MNIILVINHLQDDALDLGNLARLTVNRGRQDPLPEKDHDLASQIVTEARYPSPQLSIQGSDRYKAYFTQHRCRVF